MTPESFAADIVDSLPALAADSKINAETFIANKAKQLIQETLYRDNEAKKPDTIFYDIRN